MSLFAAVGAVSAVESTVGTVLATLLAASGIYTAARYATRVSRPRLATDALVLWLSFLGVAGIHAIGIATVARSIPLSTSATAFVVSVLTWTTLLAAASTTAFLGFREYGATTPVASHDDAVFDGDSIR